MKFVQMLRNRIRIHLDMRILGSVPLKVNLEISFRRESVSTDIAFERSLSSMRSNMNL